jgi:hypothetical protein
VATLGGNVLQRPRCWYYRLESYKCIKKGGDTCYAIAGENRYHVIFGGGPAFPPHPSNAAVPLVAYGASFVLDGPKGPRTVPAAEFFVLPAQDPTRENVLQPGELLVEVKVPAARGWKSAYYEVRERQAFDWPLVSAAIAIKAEGGVVKDARVVLGQVAPVPWRSAAAEKALVGQAGRRRERRGRGQGGRRGGAADDRQRLQGRPGHDAGAPHGRHTRVRGAMNANEAPENVGRHEGDGRGPRLPEAQDQDVLRARARGREPARVFADRAVLVLAHRHGDGTRRHAVQPGRLPARPRLLRAVRVAAGSQEPWRKRRSAYDCAKPPLSPRPIFSV